MAEADDVSMETEQLEPIPTNEAGVPDYQPIIVEPLPEQIAGYDSGGPRLIITHITNENFKSYAGVKTLGPFHKSFTSIVGPNGSGKSNVIDSMLFVFGYRASKIRCKKLSVLIHNSEQHQNLNSCTVAVHFQRIRDTGDQSEDFEVVPGSQFVVSRTAFKDNSSYYKVNDKKATYKEVATLLRTSGIDLDHNRFLILQGEVEQIAMMKPKAPTEHEDGMLEFLEDIIGSSRFKEPIATLAQRVETLNEMRGEKLNRVKATEKEKDELEGVKNEAIEYLSLENEIVRKRNLLNQKYIGECTEVLDKAVEKRDEIMGGMKEVNERLAEITEKKKTTNKEHKKRWKNFEELSQTADKMKEQFSHYEKEDIRCREDMKHAKAKAKKLEKNLEQEQKKLEELRMIPEKTERDVADLKKKLDKLETDKAKEDEKLKEVMDSLKTETQGLQAEKEEKEEHLLELQKGVNETKSEYSVAQSELDLYISNQNSEKAKLREAERNLDKTVSTLKERKQLVQDLKKKIPETEKALEGAKRDLDQVAGKEEQIAQEVRQGRVKVEQARSSLEASKSRGALIEALMNLKKKGTIPGIHGRLGDLGAIDDKYDVAISTACGALDNIVVDTIDTAQKCIEFMKKSNLGIATFIGLDKMDKWKEHCRKKIITPENVPRLFDLVRAQDETIRPAFYFALRDTLVAKDLNQASRIAYGRTRYRVVTLGGQLIDTSGTMSGGGKTVCKGRMGSKIVTEVDPGELEALETKLQKDTTEAQHCRDHKAKLEVMVDKLQRTLDESKLGLQKCNMEIESLSSQEASLRAQVTEQEQRVVAAAPDEKQLQQLEKKVASLKKAYDKAKEKAEEVEKEVHQLHRQIMDIGGTKLKAVESRLNLVQTQIDQVTGHITKANVAVRTAERNAKKTETKVENIKEEMKETAENLEKFESEFKKIEEEATKVLEGYQKSQDEMKEVEDSVKEVKDELTRLEEEEQTLQKDHIEVKHQLEKCETLVKENQQKIRHWKKELGRLVLHKIIDQQEQEDLPTYSPEELSEVTSKDTQVQITVVEEKLSKMKPNMAAIAEYRKKEELYLKRVSELDQITELRDKQRLNHDDLRKQRLSEFMAGFSTITNKLKEIYQMITLGGNAELELVDSLDPFSEGIVFSVRPPKKSWKNISNLSGGEKTLSSLALVFALHHYKPTPLYVMDEIDAALDFKNVSIVGNYIQGRTKNAQFIVISLRNDMFELADRLVGIYKTYNCTKSVTINPKLISMPLMEVDANVVTSENVGIAETVATCEAVG